MYFFLHLYDLKFYCDPHFLHISAACTLDSGSGVLQQFLSTLKIQEDPQMRAEMTSWPEAEPSLQLLINVSGSKAASWTTKQTRKQLLPWYLDRKQKFWWVCDGFTFFYWGWTAHALWTWCIWCHWVPTSRPPQQQDPLLLYLLLDVWVGRAEEGAGPAPPPCTEHTGWSDPTQCWAEGEESKPSFSPSEENTYRILQWNKYNLRWTTTKKDKTLMSAAAKRVQEPKHQFHKCIRGSSTGQDLVVHLHLKDKWRYLENSHVHIWTEETDGYIYVSWGKPKGLRSFACWPGKQ